jgi:hypothetical protein
MSTYTAPTYGQDRPATLVLDNGDKLIGERPYYRGFRKATRIYVDVPNEAAEARSGIKLDSLRYTQKGDDKAMDALWRKFNKAEADLRKEAALAWLTEHGVKDVQVRFSRKGGCSCGCSPAVVADRGIFFQDLHGTAETIYIRNTQPQPQPQPKTTVEDIQALLQPTGEWFGSSTNELGA